MRDVRSSSGVVVAADSFAAEAGASILRRGGNAVDAAIAALLVECVVQPHNVGIGGYAGAMVLYRADDGEIATVDFDSVAPRAARPGMFVSRGCGHNRDAVSDGGVTGPGANERGFLSVTVPPMIAGMAAALARYGSMPFSDVAEAAEAYAETGFPASSKLVSALLRFSQHADPRSVSVLLPECRVPSVGDTFVQQDLARLINRLRTEGPGAFYSGDIPSMIVRSVRSGGGIIEEDDFEDVRPRVGNAISVACGGCVVHTPMPPSGGLTALQTVKVADLAGVSPSDIGTARYYHLLAEAAKHAWADRFAWIGDPLIVDVPVERLLSESRAADILDKISSGTPAHQAPTGAVGGGHTVHLVVADRHGNVVSLTATHGSWFGSMVAVEGLGLVLGHGMSRFDPVPGRPNSIAPGKRMQHNMSPLLITKDGRPYCAVGLPGGRKIVNVSALLGHCIAGLGLTCGEAIDLPRFHVEGEGPVTVDSEDLANSLRLEYGDGYQVAVANRRIAGPVAGLIIDESTGDALAASEVGPECVASA